MNLNTNIIACFFAFVFVITSCTSEGCYSETDANLIVSIRVTDAEEIVAQDSITIYGSEMEDNKIYSNATIKSANLPLYAASAFSEFVIINGLTADTLKFWYSSKLKFISKACGYSYTHRIESLEFTKHRIDTVFIINELVTIENEENIRTFY